MTDDATAQQLAEYTQAAAKVREFTDLCARVLPDLIDAYAAWWREWEPILTPLVDAYQADPEAWEAEMAEERAREYCHCLCGMHSDAKGVCMGDAEAGLYRVIHSPTMGRVEVATCRPCLDAVAPGAVFDFPLADILSLTTGRLLSRRRPPADGLCELIAHVSGVRTLYGEQFDAHAVLSNADEASDEVLRQHPQLRDVAPPPGADELDLMAWLIEQERVHGESLPMRGRTATP